MNHIDGYLPEVFISLLNDVGPLEPYSVRRTFKKTNCHLNKSLKSTFP